MEPAERSFRDPSKHAQAALMLLIAVRQMRFDTTVAKFLAVRFRVIGSIGIDFFRAVVRMTGLPGVGGIPSTSGTS